MGYTNSLVFSRSKVKQIFKSMYFLMDFVAKREC